MPRHSTKIGNKVMDREERMEKEKEEELEERIRNIRNQIIGKRRQKEKVEIENHKPAKKEKCGKMNSPSIKKKLQ